MLPQPLLADFYAGNAAAFLASRGLRMERLAAEVRRQYNDSVHVLLTSSAVHGIANATSDIDLICLRNAGGPDTAMATQLYLDGAHVEVVAFHEAQLATAADLLREAAPSPLAERVKTHARIGKLAGIPCKYLERICTGVDEHGGVPALDMHADLCGTWSAAAFDQALEAAQCCALALSAGETRAASGYAANTLMQLMNSLLADAGWPLMNKKWTLKRWNMARERFVDSSMTSLREDIDRAWHVALAGFATGLQRAAAESIIYLVEAAGMALRARQSVVASPAASDMGDWKCVAFLPDANFLIQSENRLATVMRDGLPPYPIDAPLAHLLEANPAHAAGWLALVRSNVLKLSFA